MSHNGNRCQANLSFLNAGGDYAFINHIKNQGSWDLQDNSGVPAPDQLNAYGHLIDEGAINSVGIYGVFWIPTQTARPGNWVVKWQGTANVNRRNFNHTVVSGSTSGSNGRFVLTPTGTVDATLGGLRIDIGYKGVDAGDPITDYAFIHEDDEEAYDNGEVFTDKFKELCANFGVIRFLDWMRTNTCSLATWDHRLPDNYVFYGTSGGERRSSIYRGATANTGDAYTCDLDDGGSPSDKDTHIVKFNATASGNTPTLNGIQINDMFGDQIAFAVRRPTANRYGLVTYDADLNVWIKHGGDTDAGNRFLGNGVPVETMIRLCEDVGAHPWFCIPHLSLDPITDYASSLAAYCRDNASSWMKPRFEPANEVWNSAAGFEQTRYGWNKAQARAGWGGGDFQHHDWYGRVLSLLGSSISTVYSGDESRYQVMCGVQSATHASASSSNARLGGKHVSVDSGTPASSVATHVAMANYWGLEYTTTQELAAATEYAALATDEEKADYLAAYVAVNEEAIVASLNTQATNWKAWADGFGLELQCYEGGYSPDFLTGNMTATITGASKAAQCVLTMLAGVSFPPAGSSLTVSGVGGMTELNGNTYSVVSVNQGTRQITINVDSTGFTTFSSNGTATYVNSMTLRNAFRLDSKQVPALDNITRRLNTNLHNRGVRFLSAFTLTGTTAWSKIYKDAFDTPTAEWDGTIGFSTSATPLRLVVSLS